jgi:hypothetical protein
MISSRRFTEPSAAQGGNVTTTQKILTGVVVSGVLYLVFARRSAPASVARSDADRVMQYAPQMIEYGTLENIDPAVIAAIIHVESRGKRYAVGGAGEVGLMQIMPATGEWIGQASAAQLRDPGTNLRVGTKYLRYCINQKGGNVPAGIAAYNYGPQRITVEGNQVIGPEFVIRYMVKVLSLIEPYMELFRERAGVVYTTRFGNRLRLAGTGCRTCSNNLSGNLGGLSLVNVINALYGATKIYVATTG